jgi:methylthioribose-1-phosphate isomerase
MTATSVPETIAFSDRKLVLLDQTRLPGELATSECLTVQQAWDAIRRLVVRGAPAIGIAAAYGVCLACPEDRPDRSSYIEAIEHLATSRPTAVNLFWALDRMKSVLNATDSDADLPQALLFEAQTIHDEDRQTCHAIGRHGAKLLADARRVITHCNAGGLATSVWGTALAPIYQLHQAGQQIEVFADETRPLWQGARLTAWELAQAGVPVTVMTDSMAGSLLKTSTIDAVIVGADRIAANGDVANKIGTYPLAVLANFHNVPFYVAAPSSTFDLELASGDLIPIEHRDSEEVGNPHGTPIVPAGVRVMNPAFDITPAGLITAIINERGVIKSPSSKTILAHL